ncbi:MAG: PEP-CTERM sorting domain-containing protein [Planctomycetota bacterium]
MIRNRSFCLLVAGLLFAIGGRAHAAPVVFTIDSARTLITLSGSAVSGDINAPGLTIALLSQSFAPNSSQNITNSLQDRLSGTITAEYSSSASTLQFLSAEALANNGGSYRPGNLPDVGSTARAQANFGARIDIPGLGGAELAIRNTLVNLTSGVLNMTGPIGNWSFASSSSYTLGLGAGSTAMYAGSGSVGGALGTGTFDLNGYSGANQGLTPGSLTLTGPSTNATAELFIPVRFAFQQTILGGDTPESTDDIFIDLLLAGQVVAVAVVPEASSLVLLGLGGMVIGYLGNRRRKAMKS